MSFSGKIPPNTIIANASGSTARPETVEVGTYMTNINGVLSATPTNSRSTTGIVVLEEADNGTSLVSTDIQATSLVLPSGLPKGFRVRSYQGAQGIITYSAGDGCSIVNGSKVSQGIYTNGYFSDIENIGSDQWVITNNVLPGTSQWEVRSVPTVREGDSCTFTIYRPDTANSYPSGVSITVTGTGFASSGLDFSLEQALENLTYTNKSVLFDGVNTLTILPESINPIAITFFAVPTYTEIGDRDVTITISLPSVGTISTASATTTILNVSRPINPSELFPPVSVTVSSDAASGQANLTLDSVDGLSQLMVVSGSANIPALAWVESISGNVVTLSSNLTGIVSAGTSITFTPPGIWVDFNDQSKLTTSSTLTNATYTNSSGVLSSASASTARINYNPVTLDPLGLYYEVASSNLSLQSLLASWVTTNATVTTSFTTSPDGTSNAAKITDNNTNGYHSGNGVNSEITYTNTLTYTYSIYLKAGTETIVQLTFPSSQFGASQYANFDLSSGTLGSYTGVTPLISDAGSGWYRCSITKAATGSGSTFGCHVALTNTNAAAGRLPTYVGTNKYFYAFGSQLEKRSTPTSFIYTSGSVLTRPSGYLSFDIPSGQSSITITFDDASTQNIDVVGGKTYYLTTALTRSNILSIDCPGLSLDFSSSLPSGATYSYSLDTLPLSTIKDSLFGYSISQATVSSQPIWNADSYNNLGGVGTGGSVAITLAGGFTRTTSGSSASGQRNVTLVDVTGIGIGSLASYSPGGAIGIGVYVTDIVGTTITLSKNLGATIGSGVAISFWPAEKYHPLINFSDGNLFSDGRMRVTLIAVMKQSAVGTLTLPGTDTRSYTSTSTSSSMIGNFPNTSFNGMTYTAMYMTDSCGFMGRINGLRFSPSCVTTASTGGGGNVFTVADSTGVLPGMLYVSPNNNFNSTVQSVTPTTITINGSLPVTATVASGTEIFFTTQCSNASFAGNQPFYSRTTTFGFSGFYLYEYILIPRVLSPQEWRGVTLYLANKWGKTSTKTASSSVSSGAKTIPLSTISGIYQGMSVTGSGIPDDSYVVGVNSISSNIIINNKVTGISSGATITFKTPTFVKPKLLDIGDYFPTFMDNFSTGVRLFNGTSGWIPYYGDPVGKAGTYNASYGLAGHGSSNNTTTEREWYLDVLNYLPWLQYNPFSYNETEGAETGELLITASPVAPEIASLVGYTPPQLGFYVYTSGYLVSANPYGGVRRGFYQQYGYWECRLKISDEFGSWAAFWLTALNGSWPPEVDITESYGQYPITSNPTLHANASFSGGGAKRFQGAMRDVQCDPSKEYILSGCVTGPETIDIYINRELIYSFPTPWDFNILWLMQINQAVQYNGNAVYDGVTPQNFHVSHIGVWQKNYQNPSVPSSMQPETTVLINAMTTLPSVERIALINNLIASLKTYKTSFGNTLWDALDFLYLLAAHDGQAGRINWKDPSKVCSIVGSPAFTIDRGYAGTTGISYLDTGINMSTSGWQITNTYNHSGVFNLQACSSSDVNGRALSTGLNASGGSYCLQSIDGGSIYSQNCAYTSGGTTTFLDQSGEGHYVKTRYQLMTSVSINGAAAFGNNEPHALFANATVPLDNANVLIANGSAQTACVHGGIYLTPDDCYSLHQLLNSFLHSIGAT